MSKELDDFTSSLPYSGRDWTVDRVIPGGCGRVIRGEDDAVHLCKLIQTATVNNPSIGIGYSIIPKKCDKRGIYIDFDIKYRTKSTPVTEVGTREYLNSKLETIADRFVKNLVVFMLKINARTDPDFRTKVDGFRFNMLFSPRPRLGPCDDEGGYEIYKHGFHAYIGMIQASATMLSAAFQEMIDRLSLLGGASAGSEVHRILMDEFKVPQSEIKDVYDINPIKSGCYAAPCCKKPNGKVTYFPTKIMRFKVENADDGLQVQSGESERYTGQNLRQFFPIYPAADMTTVLQINDGVECDTIQMPMLDPISPEEETRLLQMEIKERSPVAELLMKLLELLPWEKYSVEHEHRFKIYNVVAHEMVTSIGAKGQELAERIMLWFLNRKEPASGSDWNTIFHIKERIGETLNDGKKLGLPWLKSVAREIDSRAVYVIENSFRSLNIRSFLQKCFTNHKKITTPRSNLINHDNAATILYKIIGHNYMPVFGESEREQDWYKYSEKTHKWEHIKQISLTLSKDVRDSAYRIFDEIMNEEYTSPELVLGGSGGITTFESFVLGVKDKLGDTTFMKNLVIPFASHYIESSQMFGSGLDMGKDVVGTLNGILQFDPKTGKATLLDGDNRHIFISRSLNARYRTDLHDGSPSVCKAWSILRAIKPFEEELDHDIKKIGFLLLSGRCGGMHMYLLFGTGADGKSTFMNAFNAVAGYESGNSFRGYGGQIDPRVFQQGKKDASGHDSAMVHALGGVRILVSPEPDSRNPQLDDGAIKSFFSGSVMRAREMYKAAKNCENRASVFMLLNEVLELIGATLGSERRLECWRYPIKFYDASRAELYKGQKYYKPADPSVMRAFEEGDDAPELRDALLYILLQKVEEVYSKHGADVDAIPIPTAYKTLTARFVGSHSTVVSQFADTRMEQGADYNLPMADFIASFSNWYTRYQNGSIHSQSRRGQQSQGGGNGGGSDQWTKKVMNMIASSPIGGSVVYSPDPEDPNSIQPIQANDITTINMSCMSIKGFRLKQSTNGSIESMASEASNQLSKMGFNGMSGPDQSTPTST